MNVAKIRNRTEIRDATLAFARSSFGAKIKKKNEALTVSFCNTYRMMAKSVTVIFFFFSHTAAELDYRRSGLYTKVYRLCIQQNVKECYTVREEKKN